MTIGLTDSGLQTETQEEIGAGIRARLRAAIDDTLALEADTPIGEVIESFASVTASVLEALRAVYNGLDPAQASASLLEGIAAMTGTERAAATKSQVTATVNVDPGTYLAGSLIAHVQGDPDARFVNDADVTNGGGGAADIAALFVAETAGATRANAGTLTVIASPVVGWNTITNAADADVGLEVETDPQLRIRRRTELAAQGSTTAAAIAATVLRDVAGVTDALGFENDTDATVDGIPPHAIEILVSGGTADDTEIATTIFETKAGGIRAYGSTVVSVDDSQGFAHDIGFTRPTEITLYVRVALEVLAGFAGETTFKTALVDAAAAAYSLGMDVAPSRVYALAHGVDGVFNVTSLELSTDGVIWVTSKVEINPREVAAFDTARVTVTSTTTVTP